MEPLPNISLAAGIVINNIETMQQEVIPWIDLANILHSQGYCKLSGDKMEMARIAISNWSTWALTADTYRSNYSRRIKNVPLALLAKLPKSELCNHTGYIKTFIVPPQSNFCTHDWLRKVYLASKAFPGDEAQAEVENMSDSRLGEIAGLLEEDGWMRDETFQGTAIDFDGNHMHNIPIPIWTLLPRNIND